MDQSTLPSYFLATRRRFGSVDYRSILIAATMKVNPDHIKRSLQYGCRVLFFGWLGAMSVLITVFILVFCVISFSSLPSDDELISQFQTKKAALTKLLEMSNDDEDFSRITRTYYDPGYVGNIPGNRWQAYRELFDSAGIRYGIERFDNDDVLFVISTSLAGDAKGYAHLARPPQHSVSNLMDKSAFGFWHDNPELGGGPAFRKIQDGWYLCRTLQY